MTQWQFLIQKEHDQDWLPLDAPGAEILEGSYRLVAQVDRGDVVVEVQIRHEYDVDGIVQEIVQRRVQHVSDGRIELLSSTYLLPGVWQLSCQLMSDREDLQSFRSTLSLQVLAQEYELLSEWEPEQEMQKMLTVPMAHPITATLHTASVTVQPENAKTPENAEIKPLVSLPSIPKEGPQITLCVAEKLRLPPLIYTPPEGTEAQIRLELPNFAPLKQMTDYVDAIDSNAIDSNAIDNGPEAMDEFQVNFDDPNEVSYLAFLRRFAKSSDRHRVHEAFDALVWRQRFLQNLNTLAANTEPPLTPDESLVH